MKVLEAQAEGGAGANLCFNPGDISKENTASPKGEDVSRTPAPPESSSKNRDAVIIETLQFPPPSQQ